MTIMGKEKRTKGKKTKLPPRKVRKTSRPLVIKLTLNMPYRNSEILPVELRISALKGHLQRLQAFLLNHPHECVEQIARLLSPYVGNLSKGELKKVMIDSLKGKASRLYALFSLLCKRPLKECPVYFQKLVQYVKTSEYKEYLEKNGKLYPVKVQRAFKKVMEKAKISSFRFHDLRHTFASYLRQRGIDLHTISKLLGHKDIRMSQRYSHLSVETLRGAISVLNKGDNGYILVTVSEDSALKCAIIP